VFSFPKRHLRKLVQNGDYLEAIEFGKNLEEKHPDDPDLLFMIAGIYYLNGDAQNTLSYLDKTLALDQNDIEALLMKANLHLYLKDKEQAADCCERMRKIDPQNKEIDEILDKLEKL
jgi:tetratricopeptide (TPR) repeat protein